jgi:hypothetical protein
MIQGNIVGFLMFIATGVIVVIGAFVLKLPNPVVMISAGLALIIIDLVMRLLRRNNQGWLMGKKFGGYLYFAPVWIFGIIVILLNVINVVVNKALIK